jgi:preprotein translocase SecF subunit
MLPLKLIPDDTQFDFVGKRWLGFALSMGVIVLTAFLIATRGLNLGIDFSGGILLEVRVEEEVSLAEMRDLLSDKERWGEVSLQNIGDAGDIMIRVQTSEEVEQAERVEQLKTVLSSSYPGISYRKIDYVGPTIGQELIESGVMALVIAMGAMMLYIWFRFEWQFGLGGIVALIHDALIMVGFYAISGFDFGLTSIAAILTVIGYSINDSVVIYDRIRENMRRYKKKTIPELLNLSINQTLSRTIVTALTTVLAALALALFGGEVLRGFSYALVVGVVVGTYSSIFIAAPILMYFGLRSDTLQQQEEAAA